MVMQLDPVTGAYDPVAPKVMAHEIGHLMGSFHDDQYINTIAKMNPYQFKSEFCISFNNCTLCTFLDSLLFSRGPLQHHLWYHDLWHGSQERGPGRLERVHQEADRCGGQEEDTGQ